MAQIFCSKKVKKRIKLKRQVLKSNLYPFKFLEISPFQIENFLSNNLVKFYSDSYNKNNNI